MTAVHVINTRFTVTYSALTVDDYRALLLTLFIDHTFWLIQASIIVSMLHHSLHALRLTCTVCRESCNTIACIVQCSAYLGTGCNSLGKCTAEHGN